MRADGQARDVPWPIARGWPREKGRRHSGFAGGGVAPRGGASCAAQWTTSGHEDQADCRAARQPASIVAMVRPIARVALPLIACAWVSSCDRATAPPVPPPPDPQKIALRAAANSAAELSFYTASSWEPAWNSASVAELKRVIAARREHALDRLAFDTGEPRPGMTPEQADVPARSASMRTRGRSRPPRRSMKGRRRGRPNHYEIGNDKGPKATPGGEGGRFRAYVVDSESGGA